MMDIILDDTGDYAAAYLDHVVIHSKSWSEHLHHITEILRRLNRAGLTVKPTKCQFAMLQCFYLGHVVGNGEVRPEGIEWPVAFYGKKLLPLEQCYSTIEMECLAI